MNLDNPTPESPNVMEGYDPTAFDLYAKGFAYFEERATSYIPQCPILYLSLVQDPKNIMNALKTMQKGGGIGGFIDFRQLSKAEALQLLSHYENTLAAYRAYIEKTLP